MADAPLRMCPPPPPTPPCSQVVGGKPLELDCIPHFDVEDVSGAHPWDAGLASKPVDRVCGKQKRRAQFDVGRRARQRGRVSVCRTVIEGRAMTCGKKRVPGMGRDARHHGGELRGNSGDGAGAREGVQGGPHTRATPPSTSHPPPRLPSRSSHVLAAVVQEAKARRRARPRAAVGARMVAAAATVLAARRATTVQLRNVLGQETIAYRRQPDGKPCCATRPFCRAHEQCSCEDRGAAASGTTK